MPDLYLSPLEAPSRAEVDADTLPDPMLVAFQLAVGATAAPGDRPRPLNGQKQVVGTWVCRDVVPRDRCGAVRNHPAGPSAEWAAQSLRGPAGARAT